MYDNFAVRSEQWRYIRYRDGAEELYDHHNDPGEHFNLAGNPEYLTILEQHRKYIPVSKSDPFFKPFSGDQLDRLVKQWDTTGVPVYLQ
jgi:iduronate 2-sulfatase